MKLNVLEGLLLKNWYLTINRLDRIFDIVYWPLVSLLLWGFTSFYLTGILKDSHIIAFFLGGVILWTFFQRAQQDITVYILEDFWSRNLYNLFSSPVTPFTLMLAVTIFSFLRGLVTLVLLGFLGVALFSFNIISLGWISLSLFVINLTLFGWVIGILVTAFIFRFGQRIQVFAWSLIFFVQPFSSVFYPVSTLPVWAQKIAFWFPSTHVFEGMRQVIQYGVINWNALLLAFAENIVLLVLVSMYLSYSIDQARIKGRLSKEG